ncbi:peptidase M16 [Endomicrobiia bacterium]|nr:peptidase M16 [Endomicrobiia bacterium]
MPLMSFFVITGACGCKSDNQATNIDVHDVYDEIAQLDVYAGLGKATDPVPFAPKARIGTLPNGLKYYILKNNQPKDKAYLSLVVNAGSVLEKDDEQGFAHFVEQIAFKGIKPLLQDIDSSSATKNCVNFSSSSTGFDETIYNFELPIQTDKNNIKRIPQKAINILDNLTYAVVFSQKDLDDQKRIILEKQRSQNERNHTFGYEGLADQKVYPILSKGSPYANCLPVVTQEAIKTVNLSKLKDFYNRWYRTDNMALVFVGDFDDAALEASLASHFHAPSPNTPLQRPVYDLSLSVKGHIDAEIITYPKQNYIETCLYYKRQPKPIVNNIASRREYFKDMLINRMLSERFEKISSKSSAPYTYACPKHVSFANSSRFYELSALVKQDKVEEAIKSLLEEKERILRYDWTDSEVELAKLYVMSFPEESTLGYCDKSSCSYARSFTKHFLARQCVIADPQWSLMAAKKMFPKITTKDLTNAARDYFVDEDLTVFVLASSKDKLPSKEKIKKIVQDVKKSKVLPPVPEIIDYKLLSKTPKPGSILKETIDQETKAVILELSNGAKVILKQTANKDDKDSIISLCALAKGGTMAVTDKEDVPSARFASEILHQSGIGPYSSHETSNKLLGKQVRLQADIDAFERSLQGYSSAKDIKTLFELIYLGFTSQKFDSDSLKTSIELDKKGDCCCCVAHRNSQNSIFGKEVAKTLYGSNPHFNVWGCNRTSRFDPFKPYFHPIKFFEMSDYPKISQKTALEFVKKCFNPADFTFVFVGDVDLDLLKSFVKTYIASIAPIKTLTNQKFTRPKPSKIEIYIDKKDGSKEDKSNVHMSWVIDEKYSLKLKVSSKVLTEYINESTRYTKGAEERIDSSVELSPLIDELSMDVNLSCDPKRVKERISAIFKDIENIAEGNIDTDILIKAKKNAERRLYENAEHNGWCDESIAKSYACSAVLHNSPLSEIDKFPFACEVVSGQDLKDIVSRLLKGKYYQIISYPKKT